MPADERGPGAPPADSQERLQEGDTESPLQQTTSPGEHQLPAGAAYEELKKARAQAAAERQRRKAEVERADALAAELAELRQKAAEVEQSKLAEQGEFKALYEKTQEKVAAERSRYEKLLGELQQERLQAHLRSHLPAHLTPAQQSRVLRLAALEVQPRWDDGHRLASDHGDVIQGVLADLGLAEPPPPAPTPAPVDEQPAVPPPSQPPAAEFPPWFARLMATPTSETPAPPSPLEQRKAAVLSHAIASGMVALPGKG